MSFHIPLITDWQNGAGPNQRLRVDVGQTGFFAGREARTFREIDLATGTTLVIKAVVPINIILFGLSLFLTNGSVKVETMVGGTEGGTFSETLPIFPRNTMSERPSPFYTPVVTLTAGGTHTGGTVLDVLLAQTTNVGSQSASVGVETGDERGVGAGTYYFRLTASGSGNSIGVFKARWEERP